MFDLSTALEQAEAGDTHLWEDIAKHLLKSRKPKRAKKPQGAYVYSCVTFSDGIIVLVGGYGLTPDSPIAKEKAERLRAGVMSGRWFDPSWLKLIPKAVEARPVAAKEREFIRDLAYGQRVNGWGKNAWSTTYTV